MFAYLKIKLFFLFFKLLLLFTLQYCIGFAIHQHVSATGVHMFPILNPPPTSLPIPSLWVIPVHQPQASCILHRTWMGDSFLIWYYTCFNAILPNHPPPRPSPQSPTCTFHFPALEKEMATHSSVLAWRIPGMGEPGGLPSLGSHRVRHDWSNLAAAAVRC